MVGMQYFSLSSVASPSWWLVNLTRVAALLVLPARGDPKDGNRMSVVKEWGSVEKAGWSRPLETMWTGWGVGPDYQPSENCCGGRSPRRPILSKQSCLRICGSALTSYEAVRPPATAPIPPLPSRSEWI